MLFSSTVFLFVFLPVTLSIYYGLLKTRKMKNIFLLIASLIFYGWGEIRFLGLMIGCIVINYVGGILVNYMKEHKLVKIVLALIIAVNLGILGVFKYLSFTIENINTLFSINIGVPDIILPLGISFFIFQGLSYVLDVYKQKAGVQKNPLNLGLYIALFPQLIAGPIVRYEKIEEQIDLRQENEENFANGITRLIKGLAKKVLLANQFGLIADKTFGMPADNIAIGFAWLGAIGYMLQIYYDFSGYSDMAIGLGKMFGFKFDENFNQPYLAKSVSEFWRRWHISLGNWFRDYVYFPLGGSRVSSKMKIIRNLFVVWILTGIWHGANWTFICWGIYFFILIVIEKICNLERYLNKSNVLSRLYLLITILIGWIIFRSESIWYALEYIKSMLGFNNTIVLGELGKLYWQENSRILVIGVIGCLPILNWIKNVNSNSYINNKYKKIGQIGTIVIGSIMLLITIAYLVKNYYNPFIYFNF